ncbi:hypothetical protein [Nocardia sp. CDC160]|uniref:hypothetical protein n=1 Tax=Nocardia sp. CDC160 TaxID=3112166 RepID=UPI002DBE2FE4|nr:hypothetical protein [Nocardia sp. CDC160]MEC3919199.1 hypothetical protein [Nocardia sp. CDC160]
MEVLTCYAALMHVLLADDDLDDALAQQRRLLNEAEQLLGRAGPTIDLASDGFDRLSMPHWR